MTGLTYEKVSKTKGRLQSLTSLTPSEFEILAELVDKSLKHRMKMQTIQGDDRNNREFVIYKNSPLPTENDRLLFVLLFLKQNITQDLLATIFDMPQSKVHYWLYLMLHSLRDALRSSGDAPHRDKDALLKAIVEEAFPLFAKMESSEA